jgi:hypothetical protein
MAKVTENREVTYTLELSETEFWLVYATLEAQSLSDLKDYMEQHAVPDYVDGTWENAVDPLVVSLSKAVGL